MFGGCRCDLPTCRSDGIEGELRRHLSTGEEAPDWLRCPEVIDRLHRVYPSRSRQGFTRFRTGPLGPGQTAPAKLVEASDRPQAISDPGP